jgi:hypothetical protein
MNILLINSNPVVSRLIELCMREEEIIFEAVENIGEVKHDRYVVVFVDDRSYDDETKKLLSTLMIQKKVLLSSYDVGLETSEIFDEVIKKPFLPSQIRAAFQDIEEEVTSEKTVEIPSIFPLSSEDEITKQKSKLAQEESKEAAEMTTATEVLDSNEIEKIKALLDMDEEEPKELLNEEEIEARKMEVIKQQLEADGLEIISEEEYVETLSSKKPKKKKKEKKMMKSKKDKEKKSKKNKEETFTFEEALIAAVEGMKVKKIKKLLKGAEVTIKINFKDKK